MAKGFTLIETLIVLAIVSMMMVVSLPLIHTTSHVYDLEGLLEVAIEKCRYEAIEHQTKTRLHFTNKIAVGNEIIIDHVRCTPATTITFNKEGHILNPCTITIEYQHHLYKLIMNLGQGAYHLES